jgi:hypothetical protein
VDGVHQVPPGALLREDAVGLLSRRPSRVDHPDVEQLGEVVVDGLHLVAVAPADDRDHTAFLFGGGDEGLPFSLEAGEAWSRRRRV